MTPKQNQSLLRRPLVGLALFFLVSGTVVSPDASAQSADKFYFWVTQGGGAGRDSFVIELDAAQKAQVEDFWAHSKIPNFRAHIAVGSIDYNKNYNAPGHPVWNWHVVSVDEIVQLFGIIHDASVQPPRDGTPSDIAVDPQGWIQKYGNQIGFEHYFITRELDLNRPDAMANVSNRGLTGSGEKTLTTGLIITGGEPRNVVVRALGPSLNANGIQQVAANPKIVIYKGSTKLATNADWKTDFRSGFLAQNYPSLVPTNDKEAALLLTLFPGTYTVQGINEDGTEGIMLIEAYDVDSTTVP